MDQFDIESTRYANIESSTFDGFKMFLETYSPKDEAREFANAAVEDSVLLVWSYSWLPA